MPMIDVPAGHIPTIITHLEMWERPPARPIADAPLSLKRWDKPDLEKYRTLFRRVGEPWLWLSRLIMDDEEVLKVIHDPHVEIYAVYDLRGIEVGILELDFRVSGECEIGFLGLIPALNGKGYGKWLSAQTMMLAWRKNAGRDDVKRVWLHTCSEDHPNALGFYQSRGFVAFKQEMATNPDPRLMGIYPEDAAPHIPLLR